MRQLLTFLFLFVLNNVFGQLEGNQECKIEIFLLKSVKPNLDTSIRLRAAFAVERADLQDTAFIKDHEILNYTLKRDTIRFSDSVLFTSRQRFEVAKDVVNRINNLQISLCCGRQFALVVNNEIVYSGYFWNWYSSWGCAGITALAHETSIDVRKKLPDYGFTADSKDPRLNTILLDCLLKTKRLF